MLALGVQRVLQQCYSNCQLDYPVIPEYLPSCLKTVAPAMLLPVSPLLLLLLMLSQGGMPSWMALLIQTLEEPAPASQPTAAAAAAGGAAHSGSTSSSVNPVHIFLLKTILHVEMRARDARQQQQQQQQQEVHDVDEQQAASAVAERGPVDVYVSNTLFAQFAEQLFPGLVAALLPQQTAAAAGEGSAAVTAAGSFHYVLRDFVMVALMWPKLFERTAGTIQYQHAVLQLLRCCAFAA
jgi:hypothetical protein